MRTPILVLPFNISTFYHHNLLQSVIETQVCAKAPASKDKNQSEFLYKIAIIALNHEMFEMKSSE